MAIISTQLLQRTRLISLILIALFGFALGCGGDESTNENSSSSSGIDSKSDIINNNNSSDNNETVYCVDVCERAENLMSECSGEPIRNNQSCTDECDGMPEKEVLQYHRCISCMESVSCYDAQYTTVCDEACSETYEEDADEPVPSYECFMYCDVLTKFKTTCLGDGPPVHRIDMQCSQSCDENPITRDTANAQAACMDCLSETTCDEWSNDCSDVCNDILLQD